MSFFIQTPNYITHANKLNEYLSDLQLNKIAKAYQATIVTPFDIKSPAHTLLISQCNTELASRYSALKRLDFQIATGALVGIVAFALSYILPLSLVALAGFAFSAWCFGKREQTALAFKSALNNSVKCMHWSLGAIPASSQQEILNSEVINTMTKILAPLTNNAQLASLIDDKCENEFIKRAGHAADNAVEATIGRSLNKEEQHHVFGIYGYEQGSVSNIGRGILYTIGALFCTAKHAITSRFNKRPTAAVEVAPVEIAAPTM